MIIRLDIGGHCWLRLRIYVIDLDHLFVKNILTGGLSLVKNYQDAFRNESPSR